MAKDKIFNIRVSDEDYKKLKKLGSIRAREILLQAVNGELFEQAPKSEMERLVYKYDSLDTLLSSLEQKLGVVEQKALSKLTDDDYAQTALSDFEDLFQRVRRSVKKLNKERFELLKIRREGTRYLYIGVRELASKNNVQGSLDRTEADLYNELASRQLIDNKEKYKKAVSELIKNIQEKIKEEELLLDSLRAMSPYIIMQESIQSQIASVKEEMKDVLFIIEHIRELEKKYVNNFLESLRFSKESEEPLASKLLDNQEYWDHFHNADLSLYDKFEKYLTCCGVDETRAKAIVKKHMA